MRKQSEQLRRQNGGDAIALCEPALTQTYAPRPDDPPQGLLGTTSNGNLEEKSQEMELKKRISHEVALLQARGRPTLVSRTGDAYRWLQETFPTATAVAAHLPFALVPFAFPMFILVQALVTRGWVPVFAYGWDHWVSKTGTIGSVGGMAFLSVVLCNVSFSARL